MILKQLPDAKFVHQNPDKYFTVGNEYQIVREIGVNGVVVIANDGNEMIVTKERFQ